MRKLTLPLLSLASVLFVACEKKTDDCACSPVENNLPETYNFENVDHSGQDTRLDMLEEVINYMETANQGAAIDASTLQDMFLNQNYTWTNTDLNGSSKDLGSKVSPEATNLFTPIFQDLENASLSGQTASNGVAGTMTSTSGKTRVFDANGYEPSELTEKLTMGAVFYYQATSVYLSSTKMNVDNETVEPGKGTDMQHHWDEAYGYWGVPNNYGTPGFTYDIAAPYHRFWAKYTNVVNSHLDVNSKLMKSFIKGRDAINRKDYATRDAAITEIRDTWEIVSAAMAIHYLNGAKANISDDMARNHELSEGAAFILSLKFNETQKMTDAEIDAIMANKLANLYDVTVQDLNDIRDQIATAYNLEAIKEQL